MGASRQKLKDLINSAMPERYLVTRSNKKNCGVIFTFDDGPHPEFTPAALDVLEGLGIRATFFLVGREAQRHAAIVKDIVARGHTVGGHTHSHRAVAGLRAAELKAEVLDDRKRLSDLSGQDVRQFRPPWGKLDLTSAIYLVAKGLQIVMWSIDSTDYEKSGASDILARVERAGMRSGDILLLHDDNEYTIEALPGLADSVRRRSLGFSNL
jgi:peptidoglycan/xylan/chitin deacetylase (PgdA/CDA1 family)